MIGSKQACYCSSITLPRAVRRQENFVIQYVMLYLYDTGKKRKLTSGNLINEFVERSYEFIFVDKVLLLHNVVRLQNVTQLIRTYRTLFFIINKR